jgi:hypothetical protein
VLTRIFLLETHRKAVARTPFQVLPSNQADSPAQSDSATPTPGMKRRRAGAAKVGREAHGSGVVESNIRVYIRTRPSATVQGETCISLDPEHSRLTLNPDGGGARAGTPVRSREGGTPRGVVTPRAGGMNTPRGNGGGPDSFHFEDGVLPEDVTQDQVFERVGRPAAEAVLAGFNVTVFAYGQTGCVSRPADVLAALRLPTCPCRARPHEGRLTVRANCRAGKTHTVYGDGGGGDRSAELGGEELLEGDTGLTGRVMELMLAEGKAGADGEERIASRFALSLLRREGAAPACPSSFPSPPPPP